MISYFEGTVFNAKTQAIVNTVNCTGVMGAGIALEFKLRYPEMFQDYKLKCTEKKIVTGKIDYYRYAEGEIIVNFPTKWHFKYPSRLIWIEQGLLDFVNTYRLHNISSVAFPKLGTSNGGLDWGSVKVLMEKYLAPLDIEVHICLDNLKYAEGAEKIMVEAFNAFGVDELSRIVKLNIKQKEILLRKIPYQRFWEIERTESIGTKTYSDLFRHFYLVALGKNVERQQITIFDIQ